MKFSCHYSGYVYIVSSRIKLQMSKTSFGTTDQSLQRSPILGICQQMSGFVWCRRFDAICSLELDLCRYIGEPCHCTWDPGIPGSTPVLPNEPVRSPMTDHFSDWHSIFGKHHPLDGSKERTALPGLEFGIHPGKETIKTDRGKLQLQAAHKRKRPPSVESHHSPPNFIPPFTKGKSDTPDRLSGNQMGKETTPQVDPKNVQLYHGYGQSRRKSPFRVISVYSPSELLASTNWNGATTDRQMLPKEQKTINSQVKGRQTASPQQLAKTPTSPQKQPMKTLRSSYNQPTTTPKRSQQQSIKRPADPKEPASGLTGSCRFATASRRSLRCVLGGMTCSNQVGICNFETQVCPCEFDPRRKSSTSIERREIFWSVSNGKGDSDLVSCDSHLQNPDNEVGVLSNTRRPSNINPCVLFDTNLIVATRHFDEATTDNAHNDQPNHDTGLSTELELITQDKPDGIGDEEVSHAKAKRSMPWGFCTKKASEAELSCFILGRYECFYHWNRQCRNQWEQCQCDFTPSIPSELSGLLPKLQKAPTSVGKEPQGPIGECRLSGRSRTHSGQRLLSCFYMRRICSDDSRQCRMSGAPCRCAYIPPPVLASVKHQKPPKTVVLKVENDRSGDLKISKLSKAHVTTSGIMMLTEEMPSSHRTMRTQQISTPSLISPHAHIIDLTSEEGASGSHVLGSKSERASQTKESSSTAKVENITPFTKGHTPPLAGPRHIKSVINPWIAALKGGLVLPYEDQASPKDQALPAKVQPAEPQPQVQDLNRQKRKRVEEKQAGRRKRRPKKMKEGS